MLLDNVLLIQVTQKIIHELFDFLSHKPSISTVNTIFLMKASKHKKYSLYTFSIYLYLFVCQNVFAFWIKTGCLLLETVNKKVV